MKEPRWKTCSAEQVWKYVAWHLVRRGIETVLVGGAVVSIYTEGAYQSGDLDLVLLTYRHDSLPEILSDLGFKRKGRHFVHPDCRHLYLEFVSAPVGIGDDVQIRPASLEIEGQTIRILSPTDCIRDRLASYIHFNARECLDQAVLVAKSHPFQIKKVKAWCLKEGGGVQFEEFRKKVNIK